MNSDMVQLRKIFERVRTHLLTQKAKALDSVGSCVYRGPDGMSCAVGCLISDEAYDVGIEGMNLDSLSAAHTSEGVESWVVDPGLDPDDDAGEWWAANRLVRVLNGSGVPASPGMLSLLQRLQRVHDSIPPDMWESELAGIERLTFPDDVTT